MTNQDFFTHCLDTYGTSPDYPFDEDVLTFVEDDSSWNEDANSIMETLVFPIPNNTPIAIPVKAECPRASGKRPAPPKEAESAAESS